MTDVVSKTVRSKMMAGIRGRDTAPEVAVRRYLHAVGLRFQLHASNLPGRPDIVLRSIKVAIFVHGCFWHRHRGCRFAATPATRQTFWHQKFETNMQRDARNIALLEDMGWVPFVIWECHTRDELALDSLAWQLLAMRNQTPVQARISGMPATSSE
ncbi:very short patch repair endonuclease [Ideonella sp.]|uniref:very short patch repair endonuclease n=1 Tax=Ideonella sp. TaxID=1929293 RepID=UPI003BB68621